MNLHLIQFDYLDYYQFAEIVIGVIIIIFAKSLRHQHFVSLLSSSIL